ERLLLRDVLLVNARVVRLGRLGGELRREVRIHRRLGDLHGREARGRRGLRNTALGVGRVLFDAHELVEELIDAECEAAELRVLELEAFVGLTVEDGEETLFHRLDRPRDVVSEEPAADGDEHQSEHHDAEDRKREPARPLEQRGRHRTDENAALSVAEIERRSRDRRIACRDRIGVARGGDFGDEILSVLGERVVELRRRGGAPRENRAVGRRENEGAAGRRIGDARELVVDRHARDERADDALVRANRRVRREVLVLAILRGPHIGARCALRERRLERRIDGAEVLAALLIGAAATFDLAALVDEDDERRNHATECRRALRGSEDLVARRRGRATDLRLIRLVEDGDERLERRRFRGFGGQPALDLQTVELETGRGAFDVVLRVLAKNRRVVRGTDGGGPRDPERQKADENDDEGVDGDDLDPHVRVWTL